MHSKRVYTKLKQKDDVFEIEYNGVEKNKTYKDVIKQVLTTCFEIENLINKNVKMTIILTNPDEIQKINKEYRNIDRPTDVLSFPMFEKSEIDQIRNIGSSVPEILGDIIISIEQVEKQAVEYGHSFERELAYMTVHGFYHIIGYDHIEEEDKIEMRRKEEAVLSNIGLEREK